jgi:hypothetical protein
MFTYQQRMMHFEKSCSHYTFQPSIGTAAEYRDMTSASHLYK